MAVASRGVAGPGLAALGAAVAWAVCAVPAQAQSVQLGGTMGDKALLIIDGAPRTLGPGASAQGVKLLRVDDGEAEIEIGGKRLRLRPGQSPLAVGTPQATTGTQIVLSAGLGGHFTTAGTINGRRVEFLVDTGATSVAIGRADAERIGIDWKRGRQQVSQTANGTVVVSQVMLSSVRIGDVEVYEVPAVVVPAEMTHVLLGNSFLTRFQMRRENDVLTLERRL